MWSDKSFVYDLNKERGIVRTRVAFVPRSAEIKPLFWRFVFTFSGKWTLLLCNRKQWPAGVDKWPAGVDKWPAGVDKWPAGVDKWDKWVADRRWQMLSDVPASRDRSRGSCCFSLDLWWWNYFRPPRMCYKWLDYRWELQDYLLCVY